MCQVLVGLALDWSSPPEDVSLLSLFLPLSAPMSIAEQLAIASFLQGVLPHVARIIDSNFHAAVRSACCPPGAPCTCCRFDRPLPPAELVAGWLAAFRHEFARAHDVLDRVRARLARPIGGSSTISELAREFGMSRRVLERRFRARCDESMVSYRTRHRVLAAAELLGTTDLKIDAIARMVGWKNRKDLYRAFARLLGVSPAYFREQGANARRIAIEMLASTG
jgi:AraC-like DNA-binding protein